MKKPITSDQMYRIEENGHSVLGMRRFLMMENAGHGVADFIVHKFKRLKNKRIVAVCGTGNNGGDGFVASRHLAGHGTKITVILLGSPSDLRSEEARLNWGIIEKMNSIEIIFGKELTDEIKSRIAKANIILDSIFGTGIKGGIREPYASAIDAINKSKAYVLAVDVPSGFDPNTGQIHEKCVRADATITFHRLKTGLTKGKKYTGPVHVEWIGIPPEAESGVL
ncbi:carbohydrate kinase, YjeF-like protein [Candidatus Nitrososphaera gargensis Ga9.2]|uniref:NAD(P)H-hydrate epimerase n=1 Tax=Nitrososphaera gargensis (strain Ga9.2) TaxID=1237085 RepID=K0IF08_NITGG|nr:NAD(P)H-hydrate epimerase [Candidatus Nitrososphaera gargensis]AFU58360.1 carbohydrate kinase, YjeF-like protein [Candidatus Nitrososphaera gargensis Ga9.2]